MNFIGTDNNCVNLCSTNCIMILALCNMLQKPLIDSSSDEGETPDDMNGTIELKNVTFRFPSRDEVPVICGHFCIVFCITSFKCLIACRQMSLGYLYMLISIMQKCITVFHYATI